MMGLDLEEQVVVFWRRVAEFPASEVSTSSKVMTEIGLEAEDVEYAFEEFELTFEILGRIGPQQLRERQRVNGLLGWRRALAIVINFQLRSRKQVDIPADITVGDLVEIARHKEWPRTMLHT